MPCERRFSGFSGYERSLRQNLLLIFLVESKLDEVVMKQVEFRKKNETSFLFINNSDIFYGKNFHDVHPLHDLLYKNCIIQ